jgi:hypothetical protein
VQSLVRRPSRGPYSAPVNFALRMMASADKVEEAKGRPARRADLIAKLIGV